MNKPMSLLHDGADWSRRLEQTVTALIGLFVFLTPFPHTTAFKEMTFYVPLAGMLVLALSKQKDLLLVDAPGTALRAAGRMERCRAFFCTRQAEHLP